jgi:hypothetical protein
MDKLKQMIEARADTLIEGKEAFLYVAKWLDSLPAADVVPAAIGEWLENEDGCQCSHCGIQQYGEYDAECMPEFCPSCFARMYCKLDGEEYAKVERFRREKEARLVREIFEGLEKIFDDYGLEYFNSNLKRQIDEFILKYTEGTDGKQA